MRQQLEQGHPRGVYHRWSARSAIRGQARTGPAGQEDRRSHQLLLRGGGACMDPEFLGPDDHSQAVLPRG